MVGRPNPSRGRAGRLDHRGQRLEAAKAGVVPGAARRPGQGPPETGAGRGAAGLARRFRSRRPAAGAWCEGNVRAVGVVSPGAPSVSSYGDPWLRLRPTWPGRLLLLGARAQMRSSSGRVLFLRGQGP